MQAATGPRLKVAKALLPCTPFAFESFDLSGYGRGAQLDDNFAQGHCHTAGDLPHLLLQQSGPFAWMYHEYVARERLGATGTTDPTLRRLAVARTGTMPRRNAWTSLWQGRSIPRGASTSFYRRDAVVVQSPVDVSRYVLSPTQEP